jgi:hypothetical protein
MSEVADIVGYRRVRGYPWNADDLTPDQAAALFAEKRSDPHAHLQGDPATGFVYFNGWHESTGVMTPSRVTPVFADAVFPDG